MTISAEFSRGAVSAKITYGSKPCLTIGLGNGFTDAYGLDDQKIGALIEDMKAVRAALAGFDAKVRASGLVPAGKKKK